MSEQLLLPFCVCERIRRNPLAVMLEKYVRYLFARGYQRKTVQSYVCAVEHFGRWLGPRSISSRAVLRFLKDHLPTCECKSPAPCSEIPVRAALRQLLRFIEAETPRPIKATVRLLPVDAVVRDFDQYMESVCGLSISTRRYRRRYAREFLIKNFGRGAVKWDQLCPGRIMKFVTDYARRCSPATGEVAASAIRSLLRFGQFHGLCNDRLIRAVPGIPVWKRVRNPKTLTVDQLTKVLDIFDRSTANGQRDYAMAVCMADLGLRVSEVAGLRLDDIDWDQGTVQLVASKGHRDRILPLCRRVGTALAAYLGRGRPRSEHRNIFVRHRAPFGEPVSAILVREAMCQAYRRAGLDASITGTHVLRHTAASLMYQRGATLKEISDVLGHQSLDTTAIYAKVNWAQLRTVALPWPEVRS